MAFYNWKNGRLYIPSKSKLWTPVILWTKLLIFLKVKNLVVYAVVMYLYTVPFIAEGLNFLLLQLYFEKYAYLIGMTENKNVIAGFKATGLTTHHER